MKLGFSKSNATNIENTRTMQSEWKRLIEILYEIKCGILFIISSDGIKMGVSINSDNSNNFIVTKYGRRNMN